MPSIVARIVKVPTPEGSTGRPKEVSHDLHEDRGETEGEREEAVRGAARRMRRLSSPRYHHDLVGGGVIYPYFLPQEA